jgi:acyl-CoA reductase-like NAD-dependent aldehyde dehydrogenase
MAPGRKPGPFEEENMEYKATIGGKPVEAQSHFSVLNPATGAEAGRAPELGLADLDAAVAAAREAFVSWSAQSDEALQAACAAVTAKIEEHQAELAEIITLEQGKPLNGLGSRWEMGGAHAWAGYTTGLSIPVKVLQDNEQGRVELHRKPLGVVGSITPWNFPVMIAIWHIMPALRTGNTVVIKPSPFTPLSTLRLVQIMNEVLPPGVVNVITGSDKGVNLGAAMSEHPDIRKIVFTGSCATGEKIMRSAAKTMKRLTLEMGGNDAGIVLPDADPKAIAEGLFWGAFINNGQTCAALKRLYVHESIHDAVCDELVAYAKNIPVGNGMEETSILGPIQNRTQFDKVFRLVDDAKRNGKVLLGGEPGEGLFFPPTIVAGLKNGDPLVDEEQFGPALPIIAYSDLEEAIRFANDSPNGLGGSVWSSDIEAAKKVASRFTTGSVWINKHGAIQPNAPFGGVKSSGVGVEFAEEGLVEYTDIQVIFS